MTSPTSHCLGLSATGATALHLRKCAAGRHPRRISPGARLHSAPLLGNTTIGWYPRLPRTPVVDYRRMTTRTSRCWALSATSATALYRLPQCFGRHRTLPVAHRHLVRPTLFGPWQFHPPHRFAPAHRNGVGVVKDPVRSPDRHPCQPHHFRGDRPPDSPSTLRPAGDGGLSAVLPSGLRPSVAHRIPASATNTMQPGHR
jgi:hypothetical protein